MPSSPRLLPQTPRYRSGLDAWDSPECPDVEADRVPENREFNREFSIFRLVQQGWPASELPGCRLSGAGSGLRPARRTPRASGTPSPDFAGVDRGTAAALSGLRWCRLDA